MQNTVAVILAAGQGARMVSSIPKVLHSICGRPMLDHVLEAVEGAEVDQIFVVTNHKDDDVSKFVGDRAKCVQQKQRLGTAHAVKQVARFLKNYQGDVLVTCGDSPLVKTETLKEMIARRRAHHTAATVLTTQLDDPTAYGRIVRNRDNSVRKIVEDKDTNIYEMAIQEVNTGTYCFDARLLFSALKKVKNDNAQKEYYLPDVIEIFNKSGHEVESLVATESSEALGINSRRDLAVAERCLRDRILNYFMESGVTIVDPATTFIDKQARIGRDTVIHPFSMILGETRIGEDCTIGPSARIRDSKIGASSEIFNSVVNSAVLGRNVLIGPFANIVPGQKIKNGATVGGAA